MHPVRIQPALISGRRNSERLLPYAYSFQLALKMKRRKSGKRDALGNSVLLAEISSPLYLLQIASVMFMVRRSMEETNAREVI